MALTFSDQTIINTKISKNTVRWLTSSKVIVVYADDNNSRYATAIVGTLSGGVWSWGTPVVFDSNSTLHIGSIYILSDTECVISFSFSKLIKCTISGTTPTFGTIFNSSALTGDFVQVVGQYAASQYGILTVGRKSSSLIVCCFLSINSGGTISAAQSRNVYTDTNYHSPIFTAKLIGNKKVAVTLNSLPGHKTLVFTYEDSRIISVGTAVDFGTSSLSSFEYRLLSIGKLVDDEKYLITIGRNTSPYYMENYIVNVTGTSINVGSNNTTTLAVQSTDTTYGKNISQITTGNNLVIGYRASSGYTNILSSSFTNQTLSINDTSTVNYSSIYGYDLDISSAGTLAVTTTNGLSGDGKIAWTLVVDPTLSFDVITNYSLSYYSESVNISSLDVTTNYDLDYTLELINESSLDVTTNYDLDYTLELINESSLDVTTNYDLDYTLEPINETTISVTTNYDLDYTLDIVFYGGEWLGKETNNYSSTTISTNNNSKPTISINLDSVPLIEQDNIISSGK